MLLSEPDTGKKMGGKPKDNEITVWLLHTVLHLGVWMTVL